MSGHTLRGVPGDQLGPVCVDLFAGCGGLTEGLLQAGIDVAASVELHPQAALTHAFNHPGTDVFVGDVRGWSDDLVTRSLATREVDGIDLVVGGPPCQGFSSAGKKSHTDPRNALFRAYADFVRRHHPRMFLLENVTGFRSMYGGSIYQEAVETFAALGYQTADAVVRASEYGVPQTRRRFIMVGWLPDEAKPFEFPDGDGHAVTVNEAIDDLSFLRPGFEATRPTRRSRLHDFARARRANSEYLFNHLATRHRDRAVQIMSMIAEGRSIRDVDASVRSEKRTMRRLDRNSLAGTVLSLPDDMIHYSLDRILTVRESARLQTFDDDFVFFGKRTSGFVERRVDVPQYTQVGNAVPPLLAAALGQQIMKSLGRSDVVDRRSTRLRRARHELVRGTSGWAGYTLDRKAVRKLHLRAVTGDSIQLPTSDVDEPMAEQRALRNWTVVPAPKRGQWAPGVLAKELPAWVVPEAD